MTAETLRPPPARRRSSISRVSACVDLYSNARDESGAFVSYWTPPMMQVALDGGCLRNRARVRNQVRIQVRACCALKKDEDLRAISNTCFANAGVDQRIRHGTRRWRNEVAVTTCRTLGAVERCLVHRCCSNGMMVNFSMSPSVGIAPSRSKASSVSFTSPSAVSLTLSSTC